MASSIHVIGGDSGVLLRLLLLTNHDSGTDCFLAFMSTLLQTDWSARGVRPVTKSEWVAGGLGYGQISGINSVKTRGPMIVAMEFIHQFSGPCNVYNLVFQRVHHDHSLLSDSSFCFLLNNPFTFSTPLPVVSNNGPNPNVHPLTLTV